MQLCLNSEASNSPVQFAGASGGANRPAPSGGCAKGMPLYCATWEEEYDTVRMGIAILHSDMKEKLRTTYFAGRRSAETAPDNPLRGGYNRRCCRRRNNGSSEKHGCDCCHLLNLLIEPIPQAFDQVEVLRKRRILSMHTCNLARILQRRWSSVPPCVPSS